MAVTTRQGRHSGLHGAGNYWGPQYAHPDQASARFGVATLTQTPLQVIITPSFMPGQQQSLQHQRLRSRLHLPPACHIGPSGWETLSGSCSESVRDVFGSLSSRCSGLLPVRVRKLSCSSLLRRAPPPASTAAQLQQHPQHHHLPRPVICLGVRDVFGRFVFGGQCIIRLQTLYNGTPRANAWGG